MTTKKRKTEIMAADRLGIAGHIVLIIVVILFLFPIFWLISTSLKPLPEWVASPPVFISSRYSLTNYRILFNPRSVEAEFGFTAPAFSAWQSLIDSAICAGLGTALAMTVGVLAAFAISRHKYGGDIYPIFVLSARMVPPVVAMIPLIVLYSYLGLLDTYIGLILAYGTFTAPYAVWMSKSFIDEIPKELEEASMIDGLSQLGAHFKVTFPLMKGGILATGLFVLTLNWSEFMLALTLTHTKVTTIPVQMLKYFSGTSGLLYGPQAALGTVAIIPLVLFSYFIHRYLARGLTFGAVKG